MNRVLVTSVLSCMTVENEWPLHEVIYKAYITSTSSALLLQLLSHFLARIKSSRKGITYHIRLVYSTVLEKECLLD